MARGGLRAAAIGWWFAILGSPPLYSQRPPSDTAAAAHYRAVLGALRDTLDGVTAATWEFNRDLRSAGAETVLARARRLRERCRAAAQALPTAAQVFAPTQAPAQARRQAAALTGDLRRLERILREQCERGFSEEGPGSPADSLRAWGPYRTRQVDDAIRVYQAGAARFAAAAGVRLEPKLPRR